MSLEKLLKYVTNIQTSNELKDQYESIFESTESLFKFYAFWYPIFSNLVNLCDFIFD
jgi:hypothetical protein